MAGPARLFAHRYADGTRVHPSPSPEAEGPGKGLGERVAVLCGGHSIRELWADEMAGDFDLVVAVNTMGFLFQVDWVVAVDSPIVRRVLAGEGKRPRHGVVTYASYKREVERKGLRWEDIPRVPEQKPYTMPRALLWVLQRGPVAIELFGVDWSDAGHDAAGTKGDHGPVRWQQEADALRAVWDKRIVAVFGRCNSARLAYFRGELATWPG